MHEPRDPYERPGGGDGAELAGALAACQRRVDAAAAAARRGESGAKWRSGHCFDFMGCGRSSTNELVSLLKDAPRGSMGDGMDCVAGPLASIRVQRLRQIAGAASAAAGSHSTAART